MPRITLSPAQGGGLPEGSPEHRYEFDLTLDHQGMAQPEAWVEESWPWRAQRLWPGEGALNGDVQYDEDYGWALRFFGRAGDAPDAPLQAFFRTNTRFRPGEIVSLTEADGREHPWRVVSVG